MAALRDQVKRRRLLALREDPDAEWLRRLLYGGRSSANAIYHVIRALQNAPCEDPLALATESSIRAAATSMVVGLETVENVQGRPWYLLDPNRLLMAVVDESEFLQRKFLEVARWKQDSPWSLIVGFDEYVPGDPFKLESGRKCMNVYYTFADLGAEVICLNEAWFNPVSILVSDMHNFDGQWSALLRHYLRLQLHGESGLMTAGVPLNLNGTVYVLKAELTAIVSDGDGHRQSLQWRGASSLRPCFRHDNVMKLGSPVVHADDSFCDISCSEYRRFHTASPNDLVADRATLLDAERRHAAGALTPAALEQTRKEVGYNTTESGLLSDAELNADSDAHRKSLYDWAHTLFQDGVFTTEMNLFLDACHEKLRKKKNEFEIYLKGEYCFPKSTQTGMRQIHRIFSQARSKKHVMKGLMSECLSMYPMARHYIETVATEGEIDLERKSFLALCHVIDVLLSAKYGSITMGNGATLLRDAVVLYFEAHTSAYGRDHFKPKTHWLFDIADQMAELAARGVAVLPDCFAIERLHQASKHVAQHVTTRGGVKFSKLALTGVRSAFI